MADIGIDSITNSLDSGLSASTIDDTTDTQFQKAHDIYDSGRYKDVIDYVQKKPQIAQTAHGQVLIANSYLSLGDAKSAVSHWKKAIDISPLAPFAYINLGNYYYSNGNVYDAIYNWTIATTIVPENEKVNLNLALAYDKINNRIKSTKYFEKYLRYENNKNCNEYVAIKGRLSNLMAKVEFYCKKVEEMKVQKDIKAIAALYLKILSTYALVPSVYSNIAEIFNFDKNYQKALEFHQIIYLYFPYTNKTLTEIANLCYLLDYKSYAYVYYKRAIQTMPDGTSYYAKINSIIDSLSSLSNDSEVLQTHLNKAKEAAARCDYEIAIDEYENYLILSESESPEIQQLIDRYKIFVNPEPFVIKVLYNQITDLMNKKALEACIEVCDRIISIADGHSKEVVTALKYKADCKKIITARDSMRV